MSAGSSSNTVDKKPIRAYSFIIISLNAKSILGFIKKSAIDKILLFSFYKVYYTLYVHLC